MQMGHSISDKKASTKFYLFFSQVSMMPREVHDPCQKVLHAKVKLNQNKKKFI